MQINNKPSNLVIPFASGGAFNPIPTDSQIATSPNKASYADGFPPATRTSRAAGGIPPDGLDMNGILHDLSNQMMWQQAVGILPWDSNFASQVGYPINAIISYNGVLYQSQNDDNNAMPNNGTAWIEPKLTATQRASQLAQNGYQQLSNGLIIQWMRITKAVGRFSGTYTFPITFPNACFGVSIANSYIQSSAGNGYQLRAGVISNSTFGVGEDCYNSSGNGTLSQTFVIAIGY